METGRDGRPPPGPSFRVINEETRQPGVERSLEHPLTKGRVIDRTRHSILIAGGRT